MSKAIRRLDRIDTSLQQMLDQLKKYEERDLWRSPKPEQWSPMQIMQHLLLAEQRSVKYLAYKISQAENIEKDIPRANLGSLLRGRMLNTYLSSPFKFKAPKVVAEDQFDPEMSFWEVARQWRETRKELRQLITDMPAKHKKRLWYKHPRAGRISLDAMVSFFELHFNRHRKQLLKRLPY